MKKHRTIQNKFSKFNSHAFHDLVEKTSKPNLFCIQFIIPDYFINFVTIFYGLKF